VLFRNFPTSLLALEKWRVQGLLGGDHLEISTQDHHLWDVVSKGLGLLAPEKVPVLGVFRTSKW